MRFSSRAVGPRGSTIAGMFLLFCTAASLVLSAQPQTTSLAFVSTAWPPFTNAPGQRRFALDLVDAALGRIGVTGKTTIVSAAEFTPSLLSGRFDGSAAAWKDCSIAASRPPPRPTTRAIRSTSAATGRVP